MKNIRDREFKIAAIAMLTVGIGLFVGGFFVPPLGVIDGSVIKAFGEILAAIGLLMAWDCIKDALSRGVDTTVTHRDTTITIGNNDDKQE